MKKHLYILPFLIALFALTGCGRATVPAGYVGVKVDLYGSEKGVQQQEVGVGKYWLTWNEEIYQFPTFNQLHNYDQPFTFQTADSMDVKAKIGVEYYVDPTKVSKIFQTYRKGVDEITEVNLRQNISDSLINHSGKMDINSLAADVKKFLAAEYAKETLFHADEAVFQNTAMAEKMENCWSIISTLSTVERGMEQVVVKKALTGNHHQQRALAKQMRSFGVRG